jgi:sugar phosphate isomerase/epimerase
MSISRRAFLAATAAVAAAPLASTRAAADKRYPIIFFSKLIQHMTPDECADFIAEVGYDGIEAPVRAKGQVLPEAVETDLPKLVDAMKKRNLQVGIITTDIREANPLNEKVLRTAAKLGIRKYRMGITKYDKDRPLPEQLKEITARFRDLAALNKELGIQGGVQNHSGPDWFAAALWDLHSVLTQFDVQHLSSHFDIAHTIVEGGLSWPTEVRLMEPYWGAIYIKDFYWNKTDKGWRPKWGPLGEGCVQRSFFTTLKKSSYAGFISQHIEYMEAKAPREEMLAQCKKDFAVLKSYLA